MSRLINRQVQIPFGLRFSQPDTRFNSRNNSSFNSIVDQVVAMRKANPALTAQKGWSTDWNTVADEVDAFNAAICERMGWTQFISQAPSPAPVPKFKALSAPDQKQLSAAAGKAKKVWQGVRTLDDWFGSGEPAVPQELSEKRAAICVACPINGKGGLEEWFTKPAAAAIKLKFAQLSERKLSTTQDDKLNVCTACLCPLKLKVHTPIQYIVANMGEDTKRELDLGCWILSEPAPAEPKS